MSDNVRLSQLGDATICPELGSFDFVPHALHEGDCFINPLQNIRIVTASFRFGGSWWVPDS